MLVVDDDPQIRSLFTAMLEEFGYIVTPVENGRHAIHEIRQREYDLIILDLSVPEIDGLDLMRLARHEYPWIKLLVVSGFMRGSVHALARKLGADHTLEKLNTPQSLLKTVCRLLGELHGEVI